MSADRPDWGRGYRVRWGVEVGSTEMRQTANNARAFFGSEMKLADTPISSVCSRFRLVSLRLWVVPETILVRISPNAADFGSFHPFQEVDLEVLGGPPFLRCRISPGAAYFGSFHPFQAVCFGSISRAGGPPRRAVRFHALAVLHCRHETPIWPATKTGAGRMGECPVGAWHFDRFAGL